MNVLIMKRANSHSSLKRMDGTTTKMRKRMRLDDDEDHDRDDGMKRLSHQLNCSSRLSKVQDQVPFDVTAVNIPFVYTLRLSLPYEMQSLLLVCLLCSHSFIFVDETSLTNSRQRIRLVMRLLKQRQNQVYESLSITSLIDTLSSKDGFIIKEHQVKQWGDIFYNLPSWHLLKLPIANYHSCQRERHRWRSITIVVSSCIFGMSFCLLTEELHGKAASREWCGSQRKLNLPCEECSWEKMALKEQQQR